jgi:hypothetical protein
MHPAHSSIGQTTRPDSDILQRIAAAGDRCAGIFIGMVGRAPLQAISNCPYIHRFRSKAASRRLEARAIWVAAPVLKCFAIERILRSVTFGSLLTPSTSVFSCATKAADRATVITTAAVRESINPRCRIVVCIRLCYPFRRLDLQTHGRPDPISWTVAFMRLPGPPRPGPGFRSKCGFVFDCRKRLGSRRCSRGR